MTTTKKATVASTNARIDALEGKLDAILAALAGQAPAAKPATKKATKAKAEKADAPRILCSIPGKPSKMYVERDWAWISWDSKPTPATLKRLKADGWKYSAKRKAWHKVNAK